jgi:hypothetical protein
MKTLIQMQKTRERYPKKPENHSFSHFTIAYDHYIEISEKEKYWLTGISLYELFKRDQNFFNLCMESPCIQGDIFLALVPAFLKRPDAFLYYPGNLTSHVWIARSQVILEYKELKLILEGYGNEKRMQKLHKEIEQRELLPIFKIGK